MGLLTLGTSRLTLGTTTLSLGGAGSGANISGAALLQITGGGSVQAILKTVAAAAIGLSGSAAAQAVANTTGSPQISLGGTGSAQVQAKAAGTAIVGLSGSASSAAIIAAQGIGFLPLGGSANVVPIAKATGGAILGLNGQGFMQGPTLYGTGRLAFASAAQRQGTQLNGGLRHGRILNPMRRGKIVEIT